MSENKNIGVGLMKPLDAEEQAKITITVGDDFLVTDARFETQGNEVMERCARVLCEQLLEKDVRDFFQMTNNVIYYNIEPDLTMRELYLATIAVMAAKRAAADYCKKNNIPFDAGSCHCIVE